jgi:hypothetical protein
MATVEPGGVPHVARRDRLTRRLDRLGRTARRSAGRLDELIVVVEIVVTIGLGILTMWVVVVAMGIRGDAVAIACLVIPPLVALAFSGRLAEISAGGVTAKFRRTSRRPVRNLMARAIAPTLGVEKGSLAALENWIAANRQHSELPVVLSLRLGQNYDLPTFARYLWSLSNIFPRFAFVAILKPSGEHVSHISPERILRGRALNYGIVLEDDADLGNFLDMVKLGDIDELLRFPGMQRKTVTSSTRLAKAVRRMKNAGEAKLLVVDSADQPVGVLEQSAALSELVLSLA